jgi:Flp pilus assembly protein TadG
MIAPAVHTQRGSVSMLVAFLLPLFLGLAAFAIDLVYLQVARNELQNDADAAALAGARYLHDGTNSTPYWGLAEQKALAAVGLNTAAGAPLNTGTVNSGYWSLVDTPQVLQPLPMVPKVYDAPAVQVTVTKDVNHNGGEVRTFFARYWGILSRPVQATAVAGLSSPGTINPGGLFPMVIAQCLYDMHWDFNATPGGPKLGPDGQAIVFQFPPVDKADTCSAQWTSFQQDSDSAKVVDTLIQKLIEEGNRTALSIGQSIWVQPGERGALYKAARVCSAAGDKTCEYVTVPIVRDITTHSSLPIMGFACLRILNADQGQKYILAEMSTRCTSSWGSGVGPNYGVVSPPSLFQ